MTNNPTLPQPAPEAPAPSLMELLRNLMGAGKVSIEFKDERLPVPYARLDWLLALRWEDNPKLHQQHLIQFSADTFGFNDPVQLDVSHNILVAGHGRLQMLDALRAGQQPRPTKIDVAPDGMWLVPFIPLMFDSNTQAYRYALLHNRAGVTRLAPEDYSGEKLSRALQAARGNNAQFALPGFGDEDLMLGGAVGAGATAPIAPLPDIPAFDAQGGAYDPGKLPDIPGYQAGQAPQSLVLMVTFPDRDGLVRAVKALSLGARPALPADARMASLDGVNYLAHWEARLLGDNAALQRQVDPATTGALPGQITFAGGVVGEKPAEVPLLPDAPAESYEGGVDPALEEFHVEPLAIASQPQGQVAGALAIPAESLAPTPGSNNAAVVGAEFYGGLPVPPLEPLPPELPLDLGANTAVAAAPARAEARKSAARKVLVAEGGEPAWIGGLCPDCGGSGDHGYRGTGAARQRIVCDTCKGAGDRDGWLARGSAE